MSRFDLYAAYYDLIYGAKDYAAETRYVRRLLPDRIGSVLELGCGTGGHAVELAAAGIAVHGVDLSVAMVARARERRAALPPALQAKLRFAEGDARHVRLGGHFDAVLALFHVMSYQTTDADLLAVLRSARAHLVPGGRFVFDFWHGPAVLADRPRVVTKTVADGRIEVHRHTTPTLHEAEHRVDVRFDVTIRARDGSGERTLYEIHPMRYLSVPEVESLCGQAGFAVERACAWLRDEPPSERSWYAAVVAGAV